MDAPKAVPWTSRLPVSRGWIIPLVAIAIGAAIRVWGASVGGDLADVSAYRHHIFVALERGQNVYRSDSRFPYFPGWLGVEMGVWLLSRALTVQFWWLIRLVIVAADVATCFAVWWAASRYGGASRGRRAAVIYALSPIAILISGHHGQFDALPTLFSVLAAGMLAGMPRPWAAGLLLGIAMALKPFPALLVPIFVRTPGLSLRGRASIAVIAGAIVLAVTAPFLLVDARAVVENIAGYGGLNDQGFGGLLRALWLDRARNIYLPGAFGAEISATTRWVSLSLAALAVVLLWREPTPRPAAAVYLAFLASFGAVSTQYLVWPLAWLLLSDVPLRWSIVYSIGTAAGAIGYYLVYWPQMLLGDPWRPIGFRFVPAFIGGQVVSLLAIWTTFGATLSSGLRRRWWREPVTVIALLVVVAALVPVVRQMISYVGWYVAFRG